MGHRLAVSIAQSAVLFFLLGLAIDPDDARARALLPAEIPTVELRVDPAAFWARPEPAAVARSLREALLGAGTRRPFHRGLACLTRRTGKGMGSALRRGASIAR